MSRQTTFAYLLSTALPLSVALAGCRAETSTKPDGGTAADLSLPGGGGTDGGGGGGGGTDAGGGGGSTDMAGPKCSSGFVDTTIAAMRAAGTAGCFRVGMNAPVVTLAAQGSNSSSRAFLQDEAGGDFSAIKADCTMSMSATKAGVACSVNNAVKAMTVGNRVTVSGFYIKFNMSNDENFNILTVAPVDGGAGTKPANLTKTLTDVKWKTGTIEPKDHFKFADITVPMGTTLKPYEWGPLIETNTSATCSAPYVFAFGLIPSTSPDANMPGAECVGNSSMTPRSLTPAALTTPSADEILISTLLYQNFKYTSDCKCGFSTSTFLQASDSFTQLSGFLIPNASSNGMTKWLTIAPSANADLGK
jgi:hypothetical protein